MEPLIKNLPHARPFPLKDQVGYEPGKVVSLTLAQRPGVGMTLFAFDAGEAISTHAAPGDAMATILEGTAQITIDGVPHTLNAGEAVIMPAGIPHAVQAVTPFKMFLVVAKQRPFPVQRSVDKPRQGYDKSQHKTQPRLAWFIRSAGAVFMLLPAAAAWSCCAG